MATKKNPDDVPAVPVPPAAPEASAPAVPETAPAPETPAAEAPVADASVADVPAPPVAPYGAAETPAEPVAEQPDPYAAPPSAYTAPPAPPAAPYGSAPAAPYGGAPAAPYSPGAAPYSPGAAPYSPGAAPYSPGAAYPGGPTGPAQGLSLAAMITGIAGAFLSLFSVGFLPAVAAVILGHMASKRQPHAKPFWLTGIITGYVGIGISVLWTLAWVIPLIFILIAGAAAGTAGY